MIGPLFVVTYACSIGEGDAWYIRVSDLQGEPEPEMFDRRRKFWPGSDRLHVAYADRSEWTQDVDWMACFELVDTADPEGLAKRNLMLDAGWTWVAPQTCPQCGQEVRP